MIKTAFEQYQQAIEAERAAFDAMKGSLPGHAQIDVDKWQAWQAAVRSSDEARQAMIVSLSKPGDLI